jgi:tetratricopeptide (TPR) repeat protein
MSARDNHKNNLRTVLLFAFSLLVVGIGYAQEEETAEDRDIRFQNHFFEALKQRAIQNFERANTNLEQCYEIDSTNSAVHFEFAKNHFDLDNYMEAEYFIDRGLRLRPGSVPMLRLEVQLYKEQLKLDRAITVQLRLQEIDPGHGEELVVLYIQNKEYPKAEEVIASMERDGLMTRKLSGLKEFIRNRRIPMGQEGKVITDERPTGDEESLRQRFFNEGDYQALIQLLELLKNAERYGELEELSRSGLELYPAQPALYWHHADALISLGKYNEAIDVLSIGIDFVIQNDELKAAFYRSYSEAYGGLNDPVKAEEYMKKADNLRKEEE